MIGQLHENQRGLELSTVRLNSHVSYTRFKIYIKGDVLLLGKTNTFRYNHPGEAAKLRKKRMVSF